MSHGFCCKTMYDWIERGFIEWDGSKRYFTINATKIKTGSIMSLYPTYCPFCGERIKEYNATTWDIEDEHPNAGHLD